MFTYINGNLTMAGDSIRVRELSRAEAYKVGVTYPDASSAQSTLVISGDERVLAAIEEFLYGFAREEERSERLLEIMTESVGSGVPEESRVLQIQRQAEARDRFLKEFPTLTSQRLAELNGSIARNTAALASRWKSDRKIFALSVGRTDRFPEFQFGDDGRPLPAIARIIEIFGDRGSWALALWFASNSGWLGGDRPADVLLTRPDDAVEAARLSIEPIAV